MLTFDHPEIVAQLRHLIYGFQPVRYPDASFCLLLKASVDIILTARLNNEFKVYLIPDPVAAGRSLGFITAFFDDHDEPLVLFTLLYAGDAMLTDLTKTLGQESFKLYFFDEHCRELLGVSARLEEVARFR